MKDVVDVEARFKEDGAETSGNHDNGAGGQPNMDSLKTWGWISYGLHLAVALAAVIPGTQVGVGLLLVAMLIDWVKRPDARGTWQESHYSWRIRSVLIAGVLYVVTAPLLLVVVGLLLWFVISLWLLYRIVRGMVCMADNRAVSS
jgi:uncharacterized membrane protein